MTLRKVCFTTALALALPLSSFAGQVSFQNHSNNMITSGDNSFYHADFNNDGLEDLAYIYQPSGTSNGTFDVEFSQGSYNEGLYSGAGQLPGPALQRLDRCDRATGPWRL